MKKKAVGGVLIAVAVMAVLFWFAAPSKRGDRTEVSGQSLPTGQKPVGTDWRSDRTSLSQASPGRETVTPAPADYEKLRVLQDVIATHNDNDPRLDTEFKVLSPGARQLFRSQYTQYAMEKRNERGTVVFLLGRNLETPADVEFLASVVAEPPCLSMADCSQEGKQMDRHDLHQESGLAVSLAYPQMVALYSIERYVEAAEQGQIAPTLAEMRKVVDAAANSPVGIVSEKAAQLKARMANIGK